MSSRMGVWGVVILAACLAAACGEEVPELTAAQDQPIINGTADTSQAHLAVVNLQIGWTGYCTGTLIAPEVIMTAAHCVYRKTVSTIKVGFGLTRASLETRTVAEVWVHPGFNGSSPYADLALLRLATPEPAGIAPIPILPHSQEISAADLGVTPLTFVGFGKTETGSTGTKLQATDNVEWMCLDQDLCTINGYQAARNNICNDQDPGGMCVGDSGGPAFVQRNGKEYAAGVISFGGEQDCSAFACSTKVDEYEAEIKAFIGTGGLEDGAPCADAAECQSGFCEGSVCCNTACLDSNVCNGVESCQTGTCQGDTPLDCDDGVPCTTDSCDPSAGCQHASTPNGGSCSDGNPCNGAETCLNGACSPGAPPTCDDGKACTTDSCAPASGCVFTPVLNGTSCADANPCNGVETCQNGVCSPGTAITCDDANPCTTDSCDPASGCRHDPVANGTSCGGGACGAATCQDGTCMTGSGPSCDDQNPCTADSCNPEVGCLHTALPDSTSCGDCRSCTAGVCQAIPACQGDSGGCSCQTGPAGPAALWLALMALAISRKGRRR